MDRFLASVAHAYEEDLFSRVANTLSNETKEKLEQLLEEASENDLETSEIRSAKHPTSKFVLNDLKKDTSQLKKQSILYEINKYMAFYAQTAENSEVVKLLNILNAYR